MNHHQISLTDDKTCLQSNSFFPKKSSSFIEALEIKPKMSNNNHRYIYLDILNTLNGIINFSINIEVEDFPFYSLKKLNIDESTYLCGYIGLAIMQYEIYSPDESKLFSSVFIKAASTVAPLFGQKLFTLFLFSL